MKHCEYLSKSETIYDEDIGSYVSYGITVRCDGEEILTISDVSTDRKKVERLAELCNDKGLSVCHIYDVIEDILP